MAVTAANLNGSNDIQSSWRSWLVCMCGSLFFFYEFIQLNMFNAINNSIMQDLSLTAADLGSLSAYYLYANIALLFVAGLILDRYSVRWVMLSALLICILGLFGFSMAHQLGWAKFCYALTGIGGAFVFLSCLRLASRWFPVKKMALVTGFIVTMAMLGGELAQWPLMRLVENVGWRNSITYDAYLGIVIWVVIFLVVRDCPKGMERQEEEQHHELERVGMLKSLFTALKSTHNWLCGIYTCLMNLPISLFGGVWGVSFLFHVHHLSNDAAASITTMLFNGTIIGSPLVGWWSDKTGSRKMPMIIGAIISFALLAIMLMTPSLSYWSLWIMFFLIGLFTSTQVLSYPFISQRCPPTIIATSLSIASFVIMGGQGIFRWVYGSLIDWHAGPLRAAHFSYNAGDFSFASWMMPITIILAILAIAVTRSESKA